MIGNSVMQDTLSRKGRNSPHARGVRRRFDQRLRREVGEVAHAQAHALLVRALEALGDAEAVRRRRVRPPEATLSRWKARTS